MSRFNVIYPDLVGKTVLITGAGRGIGKSLAEGFMLNQCKVIALYRNTIPKYDQSILNKCTAPEYLHSDIQNMNKIKLWLDKVENRGQSIDILINNAGVYDDHKLGETDEVAWDKIMNINLKATFFLSQLLAKHMKNNTGGVIINAASFAASIASFGFGIYAASKAALISLTQSMAAEYAPYNIRVNAFSPGVIKTDMTEILIEHNSHLMLKAISQNRFGKADDVVKAVSFLASDESSYITGINLDISGGKYIIQNPSQAWDEREKN